MDVIASLQNQIVHAHRLVDATMEGITDEQFSWMPPGTVNPIQAAFIHTVAGEDFFIQGILQGKSRLWETQCWGAKIGLEQPPGRGGDWAAVKNCALSLGPMLEYQTEVRAATDSYLAALDPAELGKPANFPGYPRPVTVGDVLVILAGHIAFHAGEISAVKGVQGAKGLPY